MSHLDWLEEVSSKKSYALVDSVLLEPYEYLASIPGKEIRSAMIDAFNSYLNVDKENLAHIKSIVARLHTASLLVDDVEDNAKFRRGSPVAHDIYGVAQTVNTANFAYFLALQEMGAMQFPHSDRDTVTSHVLGEIINLHRGQGLDLYWRDHLACPTESDYVDMVNNNAYPDFLPFVSLLGVYFQIHDDYANLSSVNYTHNKGFAEDLTEGKFSFLIIHSLRMSGPNSPLFNILRQKPTSDDIKHHAIRFMQGTGSFDYTTQTLHALKTVIMKQLDALVEDKKPLLDVLALMLKDNS